MDAVMKRRIEPNYNDYMGIVFEEARKDDKIIMVELDDIMSLCN